MWRQQILLSSLGAILLVSLAMAFGPLSFVVADTASAPSLTISQLKITSSNGQFITLYNATDDALDMSHYQLHYFNNYDLSKATSSRLISLSGTVPPHGYFMVNDAGLLLCYQLTVQAESLGLSSTAGFVEVLALEQTGPGGAVQSVVQDYVAWSKTAASGAQTLPTNTSAFLRRLPLDEVYNPTVINPGAGSWQTVQPDPNNSCDLVTASGAPAPSGQMPLLPATEPPATIVNISDESSAPAVSGIPAGNIGLMIPQITELLPNPDGTGNDTTDEFIELYNPNDKAFDLSGSRLQTGLTTTKSYTFSAGTSLKPKSFTAFYSEQTDLSLSNTSSQVKFLDPLGNSIAASSVYQSAKDGQAWALANGKWYWTTSLTPNAANIIKQPVKASKAKTATSSKAQKTTGKVKSEKTGKSTNASQFANTNNEEPTTTPIHVWTLALIIGLALLYGAYEYRADVANRIYQLRRYFGSRRSHGS